METLERKIYVINKEHCPELFGKSNIIVGDILVYDGSFIESGDKLIIKRDENEITVVYRLSNGNIGLDILEQGGCSDLVIPYSSEIYKEDKNHNIFHEQLKEAER